MKFNFKKIASVITSTVMLSSTIAFAAAANFPAPFVTGSGADVAVVYGATAGANGGLDYATVLDINSNLNSAIAAQGITSGTTVISGTDVVELDRSSALLHLGAGINGDGFAGSIKSNSPGTGMPTLLADGVFTSYGDNKDHDYTQKLDLNNLTFTYFDDSNYNNDQPSFGLGTANAEAIVSGTEILNYTLTFNDKPTMTTSNLDSSTIEIMGKPYLIVDAQNGSSPSLTLLDSANTQVINEGATQTITINGQSYDVTVISVSSATSPRVKLSVNGKTTSSLAVGSTYKVADGAYIGVKDATYQSKDASVSNAELAFGAGKLEIDNAASVQLNDNSISDNSNDDVIGYVNITSSNTLSKIILQWKASSTRFVTDNSSLVMPGFNTIKVSTTGMVFPNNEETSIVTDGKYTIKLEAPIADGDASISLLSNNQSVTNYTIIGKDAKRQLRTSNDTSITFDSDTDENFVASWAGSKDAESYVLYANSFRVDSSVNKTTINKRVGSFSQDVQNGDTITLGDLSLTVGQIDVNGHSVVLTGSAGTFDTLYTKDGLKVLLPFNGTAVTGALSLFAGNKSYPIQFWESNKDGTIAGGDQINVTLGLTSDSYVKVNSVTVDSGLKEEGSSNIYTGFAYSDLATKVSQDEGPDQNTATLTYHGGESYAKVFVSDVSATVSGGSNGAMAVSDSEVTSVQGKNLIVVGGSCINTVAATLLGSSTPLCGADWQSATNVGAGSFLIQTFASPYATGKIATLVAGYNAGDTTNAGKYLTTQTVDTTVGKKLVGTTESTATLVTS